MGVTGLWTVVQPCARPIKLETLNKKRLAVDASIWIYQFLKAVRDKEGNALRNSHVVGFFRRICKLLFFGIKPVFVFDGGAPALKRQTISNRKQRREGRREDAVRTAGKLLAVQMQRRAEDDAEKKKKERERPIQNDHEEVIPDNLVYVDELQMTQEQRQQNRRFKKKDAYHLPELDSSLSEMGAPNDPRIMSQEELEEYAQQFNSGEDINLYDFSKIDFNSPFFLSLPASDRYNILNAARLRSRLRMGYSKEQLDDMFPDRMAFSRFQIERVTERNELTQRLMNINGMNGEEAMLGLKGPGRVAGEKGKEYVLVKNDGVEGGWALGVVSNKDEGNRNKPIDVDDIARPSKSEDGEEDEWEDDEGGFEDVPIEGLNRLPRRAAESAQSLPKAVDEFGKRENVQQRRNHYESRKDEAVKVTGPFRVPKVQDPDSLFVQDEMKDHAGSVAQDKVDDLFNEDDESVNKDEQEDLDRAIALSLEHSLEDLNPERSPKFLQEPGQSEPEEPKTFSVHADRMVDASDSPPKALQRRDSDEDDMDLQAALAKSRRTKRQPEASPQHRNSRLEDEIESNNLTNSSVHKPLGKGDSSGPLPFEKLDFGRSLLGAKKSKAANNNEGGFTKTSDQGQNKKAQPLPPWFSSDVQKDTEAQKAIEEHQFDNGNMPSRSRFPEKSILNPKKPDEVIDVDAPIGSKNDEVEKRVSNGETLDEAIEVDATGDSETDEIEMHDVLPVDSEIRMGDLADLARAEPPLSDIHQNNQARAPLGAMGDDEKSEERHFEWKDGDQEGLSARGKAGDFPHPAGGDLELPKSRSPSLIFENVEPPHETIQGSPTADNGITDEERPRSLPLTDSFDDAPLTNQEEDAEMDSDPEDDDLLRQLAVEAEEHARFASELNNKSQVQNQEDYERELRTLRSQQKKDRRDADEVSHIMVTECQQLLKFFGLPYITAPMEAEAQCAELVRLGLVDGIVTDDSDIFLFGGTRVYKNMFNQAKYVECYLASDLEKEFDLDREKLIRIAHLLGSDYTEGIPSVGPVTALEIVSEFNSDTGLEDFREWWQNVQLGKQVAGDLNSPFRKKFRRTASRLLLPTTFPSPAVSQAYHQPDVDSDPQPFFWGTADLDALRAFLMATIGWTQERTDEVLVPVIKDMNRRENEGTQSNITGFFSGSAGTGTFAPKKRKEGPRSGRLKNALGKLKQGASRKRGLAAAATADEEQSIDNDTSGKEAEKDTEADRASSSAGEAADKGPEGRGQKRAKVASKGRAKRKQAR
ncbi:MAG: DNA repair protein rad2 [Sclerophora amabilis]|nr:MAG: DNA repair protein rad2 [Sclerophora amabilis]